MNPTILKKFECCYRFHSVVFRSLPISLAILPIGPFDVLFVTYRYLDSDVLQMVWQKKYVHQMQQMPAKTSTQLWKIYITSSIRIQTDGITTYRGNP